MARLRHTEDWGTLGIPVPNSGDAQLLHLVKTDVAILRHGFYGPGVKVSPYQRDCPSLVYGVGGPCRETAGPNGVIRRRLTYHPAGCAHALEFLGNTHVLSIEINPALEGALGWPSQSAFLPATLYELVWRAMVDVASHAPDDATNASLQALVEAAMEFTQTPPSPLVMALIDELHTHWADVPSVDRLSQKYSLSKQYICRVFKKAMGVTLQQYGLLVRLDYARGRLWGTDSPIADIAAETGFADQSHLTRALAARSDWTPLRLRWLAPCREIPSTLGGSRAATEAASTACG